MLLSMPIDCALVLNVLKYSFYKVGIHLSTMSLF